MALTLEQCWHRIPGGTAVATLGQLRGVLEAGGPRLRVTGVAARHGAPPSAPWIPPVPVRHLPLPRPVLYEAWHRAGVPPVQWATGPVDLVHATTLIVPPRSAPLAVTIHDLAFLAEPGHLTRRGLRFHRRGLALALRRADLVLVPSHDVARDCLTAGFGPSRVRVVPWGVDGQQATAAEVDDARAHFGLARPYVLFVGTVEPRKNLAAVVDAFGRVGEGHDLVLLGPQGWGTDLAGLVQGLGSRVRPLGFVAEHHRRALLAGAAALCFPSLREGFGLPVLEAMAQGTPVVTSSGTATEEVAGGAAVLVDPRRPSSVAEGLALVLHDAGVAAQLAVAGRARAAAMTWAATGRATLACYDHVLGTEHPAGDPHVAGRPDGSSGP